MNIFCVKMDKATLFYIYNEKWYTCVWGHTCMHARACVCLPVLVLAYVCRRQNLGDSYHIWIHREYYLPEAIQKIKNIFMLIEKERRGKNTWKIKKKDRNESGSLLTFRKPPHSAPIETLNTYKQRPVNKIWKKKRKEKKIWKESQREIVVKKPPPHFPCMLATSWSQEP